MANKKGGYILFKKIKSNKGETLVEVIVSCALFGVLVTLAVTTMIWATNSTAQTYRVQDGDAKTAGFLDGDTVSYAPDITTSTDSVPTSTIIDFGGTMIIEANGTTTEMVPPKGHSVKEFQPITFESN